MLRQNYDELKNALYPSLTKTTEAPSWRDRIDGLSNRKEIKNASTSPIEDDEDEDEEDTRENTSNQEQQDDKTEDREASKTDSENNELKNNEVNKNEKKDTSIADALYKKSKSENENNKNSTDYLLKGKISNSGSSIDPVIDDSKDNIYNRLHDKDKIQKNEVDIEEIKNALYNKSNREKAPKIDPIIDNSKDDIDKVKNRDTFKNSQKKDEAEEIKDALYNRGNREKVPKLNPVIDNSKDDIDKVKNSPLEEIKEALYGKKTVSDKFVDLNKKIVDLPKNAGDKVKEAPKNAAKWVLKLGMKVLSPEDIASFIGKNYNGFSNFALKKIYGKDAAGMLDISHKKINDESYIKNAIKIENYRDKRFAKYEGYLKEKLTKQFEQYNKNINEISGYYFIPESEPSLRIANDSEFREFLKNNKDNILNNRGNLSIEFKKDNLYYAHHYVDFIDYRINENGDLEGIVADTNDYNKDDVQ